jgi:hypothetical protein
MMNVGVTLLWLAYASSVNHLASPPPTRTEEDFVALCESELRLSSLSSEATGDRYCSAYLFGYLDGYLDSNRATASGEDKISRTKFSPETLLAAYVSYVKEKSTNHKRHFRLSVKEFMKDKYRF